MSVLPSSQQIPQTPVVRFCSGRSESFTQSGPGATWRRLSMEEEARLSTGFDRETKAPSVGIYIIAREDRVKIGFDLWRIDLNLSEAILDRLRRRWNEDDGALFSKAALRTVGRKVHFSKTFITVITIPERSEFWKAELESILVNPGSFEHI